MQLRARFPAFPIPMAKAISSHVQRRTFRSKHYRPRMAKVTSSSLVGSTHRNTPHNQKETGGVCRQEHHRSKKNGHRQGRLGERALPASSPDPGVVAELRPMLYRCLRVRSADPASTGNCPVPIRQYLRPGASLCSTTRYGSPPSTVDPCVTSCTETWTRSFEKEPSTRSIKQENVEASPR